MTIEASIRIAGKDFESWQVEHWLGVGAAMYQIDLILQHKPNVSVSIQEGLITIFRGGEEFLICGCRNTEITVADYNRALAGVASV